MGFESIFGDLAVFVIRIFGRVERQKNKVGGFDGVIDLILDASFEVIIRVLETSGVNQEKTVVNSGHDVVAGGAFFAGDDGDILAGKTVQNAGFASVSLTNECDNGEVFHDFIITQVFNSRK